VIAGMLVVLYGCGVSGSVGGRKARPLAAFSRVPLAFERNVGQSDARVRFLARSAGSALFFTPQEAVLALAGRRASRERVLRIQFLGATHPIVQGAHTLAASVNYFLGRDRSRWHTGVPTFARVRYVHLWRGVDASFYGNGTRLEYDLELAAGADPARIALRFVGAHRELLDSRGQLVLTLPGGRVVRELPPVSHQLVGGVRRAVESHFVLSGGVARLALGSYDHRRPVTVDPALVYSTYLGGSGQDEGHGIAVDSVGNAYVTGYTASTDFPTQSPEQPANGGPNGDAFVAKLNPAGNALLYSTYLGGDNTDKGMGIAVDTSGDAYVTGLTFSSNFPTHNAMQPTNAGGDDAFVTKLSPAGNALVYSTYMGTSDNDQENGIAVDSSGNAYVAGQTQSSASGSSPHLLYAKLNSDGSRAYEFTLSGNGSDEATGIAVDGNGDAYITGDTSSTNLSTPGVVQPSLGGSTDAFVAEFDPTGGNELYLTYLGGGAQDFGQGIAIDSVGAAYITGVTNSTDFPTQNPMQPTNAGGYDAFVTKLSPAGKSLVYSTYVGGSDTDNGMAIAVDSSGAAYVTGLTFSTNYPTKNAEQLAPDGSGEAFVTKLAPAGDTLVYSTYLGGVGKDTGSGIAVDSAGDAFVAGTTMAPNFPTVGAAQPACGDSAVLCLGGDGFVTKLPFDTTPPASTNSIPSCHGPVTVTVTDDAGGSGPQAVHYRLDGGAEQIVPTTGNPGIATIPIGEGNHTLEDWGQDASGNLEFPHHASVQVDTTPPSLSITSDQRFLAYVVNDPASVTITASDATSGLATDPSASNVAVATDKPGPIPITRSATDRCGNTTTKSLTLTVIDYPKLAQTVDAEVVAGTVGLRKGGHFVQLTEPRVIPIGSTLDTTKGTIRLITATAVPHKTQDGTFSRGLFSISQARKGPNKGLATLSLIEGLFPGAPSYASCKATKAADTSPIASAALSSKVLQSLHASAHGKFRTRGRYSAATVRGTVWTMSDRCDGTLTVVHRGTVAVRDFVRHVMVLVHAGHRYLAIAPSARHK
jgi:hypothetical protein